MGEGEEEKETENLRKKIGRRRGTVKVRENFKKKKWERERMNGREGEEE
jgi:hypothetical protein